MVDVIGKVGLDRALHFDDLWNRAAFEWINTVPSFFHPDFPATFTPRGRYTDDELDFRSMPFGERYRDSAAAVEMQIVRGATEPYFQRGADGSWRCDERTRKYFDTMDRAALPEALRRRTLIVVSPNSPYYVDRLTAEERARDEAGYRESLQIWRDAGYHAMTYPAGLTVDDFGDRTHLTVPGGQKLAVGVAEEISRVANGLGYFQPAPAKP